MENMTDPTDRVLFIFDYTTNSHNSLKTVLKLEKKYYRDLISIYTEVFDFQSIKFIYILYGNKTLQLIQFEPENSLVPEFKFSNPFMPNKFSKMLTYSPSNVTLEIFPLLVDRETSDTNTSLNLVVHSENYGQIMELRSKEKDIFYLNIDQQLNISLLDYFDGSNQNYITLWEGNMWEFEYPNTEFESIIKMNF